MAIRDLTSIITWIDPSPATGFDPFWIYFELGIWSKNENGVWELRHSWDTDDISGKSNEGGAGWSETQGTSYNGNDPNAEFYGVAKFQLTTVVIDNVEYTITHPPLMDTCDCNGSGDLTFHFSNFSTQATT